MKRRESKEGSPHFYEALSIWQDTAVSITKPWSEQDCVNCGMEEYRKGHVRTGDVWVFWGSGCRFWVVLLLGWLRLQCVRVEILVVWWHARPGPGALGLHLGQVVVHTLLLLLAIIDLLRGDHLQKQWVSVGASQWHIHPKILTRDQMVISPCTFCPWGSRVTFRTHLSRWKRKCIWCRGWWWCWCRNSGSERQQVWLLYILFCFVFTPVVGSYFAELLPFWGDKVSL